ncbi:hypothetical protein PT144_05100 (plasmid) [Borreliella garinii]|uniref:hypothetical protein n=1 Tax=Borreliella garinii TaxID=29519 RepID=UPI002B4BBAB3|nr:hypothetical protein [Borreliella garinii]WRM49027.1 hypothetical protein PT144_04475 [Borreliella garinii]WRM49122.1 hypothetical protein PT144_05045 [Borreliella garinii]WRM49127.1 hypothetical protein PT144_05100 [Borreliella garinii]
MQNLIDSATKKVGGKQILNAIIVDVDKGDNGALILVQIIIRLILTDIRSVGGGEALGYAAVRKDANIEITIILRGDREG